MMWISRSRTQIILLDRLAIKEKYEFFEKEIHYLNFKESNCWFKNFKKHNITFLKVCDESACIDKEVCKEFRKKIGLIMKDYEEKDVLVADETEFFLKCAPDKTIHIKGETCNGGRRNKEHVTLLFCVNMNGTEKLKPLMIGKLKNLRCFTGKKSFP